jgi:hypothetical protein
MNTSFLEYKTKWDRDNFAQCIECNRLKSFRASSTRRLHSEDLWNLKLKDHIVAQRTHWKLYYANINLSISEIDKVIIIIHNKMDHLKTTSSHFFHRKKTIESFMWLLISIIGIITHTLLEKNEIGNVAGAITIEDVEKWILTKDMHISNCRK